MAYVSVNQIAGGNFRRKWANGPGSVDPYITGFMLTDWLAPEAAAYKEDVNATSIILSQTCLSVTLPGGTVNRAEFQGLGNQRFSVPGNVDWDNTLTSRFLEFSGCPILDIFHAWVVNIRDYSVGISQERGDSYGKANYSGTMYYATFDPGGQLEEYECATGIFPLKDPRDSYGHDLTAIDKLEVDIDFNVDTLWHDSFVKDYCQNLLDRGAIKNLPFSDDVVGIG